MSHLSTFADYPDINSLDSSLLKTLNRLAPTLTKTITPRLNTKWFNRNLSLTKRQLRYTEKKWRKHKSEENLTSFKQLFSKYRQLIKKAKREYYTDTITAAGNNAKKLYQISNSLLGRTTPRILPDCPASTNSANFDNYFNNKIINIINSLPSPTLPSLLTPSYSLHSFKTPSIASINNLLLSVKSVCMLDPIPLILLNKLTTLLSTIQTNNRPLPHLWQSSRSYEKCTCHSYTKKKITHMINLISPTTVQFPIYHIYPKLLKELYLPNYTTISTTITY